MCSTRSTTSTDRPPRRAPGCAAAPGRGATRRGAARCLAAAVLYASGAFAAPEAVSADGAWRLQADGTSVRLIDAGGQERRRIEAAPLGGGERSAPAWVRWIAARRSFVVGFETLPELWEISTDPRAEPVYSGWVHDYRMGEGIAEPGFLGVRRTRLAEPLPQAAADPTGAFWLGRVAADSAAGAVLVLVQIDVRRAIARFTVDADPDLARARAERRDGRDLLVVPDRRGGVDLVVDVRAARRVGP